MTQTTRYTACFAESGEPWLEDETFASLKEVRARVEDAALGDITPHRVILGRVQIQDGQIDWWSWELEETVWAGDTEPY